MTVNLSDKGLSKIANSFDLFYIDIWGVLHNGIKLNEDAVNVLFELDKLGKVSFNFAQEAFLDGQLISEAYIKCGSLDSHSFTPSSLPEYLHKGMKKLL